MDTVRQPSSVDVARVQAHYDLGDEFFALFLDPSMTYSCAKFESPDMSLSDAQQAKIDLSLAKCELRPGLRLLDIGCGWGATSVRACDHYGAKVIGLTISQNQYAYAQQLAAGRPGLEFRLQGWEAFEEKADRIVSIGAFEHFGRSKYPAFFARCREMLPEDGVMLLHTITLGKPNLGREFLRFGRFLVTKIFPGGEVPPPELVVASARAAGLELVHVESLRAHYAKTLDCWAANLQARQERAVVIAGEERYLTFIKYLTGCAAFFRSGECNVHQFKLRVA
jgi:cyclopropane-fatty-acyl-phospholipid synthase